MALTNTSKKIVSAEKWLEIALDVLAGESKNKFNLDALISDMPVSKGSFYWHFKNRKEFLFALVDYWDRTETQSVVNLLENLPEGLSAEDKLWALMCEIREKDYNRHDALIRSLIREFPELRAAVEAVDRKRINTIRSVFEEMGFTGDELEMRVIVFVITTSQEKQVLHQQSEAFSERHLKLRHKFFTRP